MRGAGRWLGDHVPLVISALPVRDGGVVPLVRPLEEGGVEQLVHGCVWRGALHDGRAIGHVTRQAEGERAVTRRIRVAADQRRGEAVEPHGFRFSSRDCGVELVTAMNKEGDGRRVAVDELRQGRPWRAARQRRRRWWRRRL